MLDYILNSFQPQAKAIIAEEQARFNVRKALEQNIQSTDFLWEVHASLAEPVQRLHKFWVCVWQNIAWNLIVIIRKYNISANIIHAWVMETLLERAQNAAYENGSELQSDKDACSLFHIHLDRLIGEVVKDLELVSASVDGLLPTSAFHVALL